MSKFPNILDLDVTGDVAYGRREGRFYHGYYRDYCYLPLYVFCGEHLLCARLRMSNIDASADSVEELEPLAARIRQRWPAVKIPWQGDGGFCREKLMAWREREGLDYIFGLARNPRLKKQIEPERAQAETQYQLTQAHARVFTEFFYATEKTWSRQRRVIAKAGHIAKGANPRFVVTSLSQQQRRRGSCMSRCIAPAASVRRIASRSSSWICLPIGPAPARCGGCTSLPLPTS